MRVIPGMEALLKYGVFLALGFTIAMFLRMRVKGRSFGRKATHAKAAGNAWSGIIYAFGRGMAPWEKESAKKHLPTYFAGLIYHAGIFTAFMVLVFQIFSLEIPAADVLRALMAAGLAAGIGLLIKRISKSYMRILSSADDYSANILVDLFVLFSMLSTWIPVILSGLYVSAIILLIYIPLGKIRHCFFFFYSRIIFGTFFGRRGVYPHKKRAVISK
jgi:nitrate reductase gamma subunit